MMAQGREEQVKNKRSILIVILAILLFIMTSIAVFSTLERYAANQLLNKLTLAKPGVHISEISKELGREMLEESELKHVILLGSVKDEAFCKDKKLYWFYASTPPCRVLEVYTDTDDFIVYVTWSGL